ncbi:hypothetical protein Micbo1qcDRAFT_169718 [Microdochium bolleyi]|uniref:FAD/NAD(P)-binding domain-containing protein n=1 Tax=Microdochium bolleyi TaxID=196109 RepID=A0A136IJB0_9PEZI|nr:hypothetical protein Micbo1qcDRAFT_169718 [Microdochium bolleyi]
MANVVDVLVLGAGPAGLTAALSVARQRSTCVVFDSGSFRNDATDYMHLIPGFDHVAPSDFRAAGSSHLTSYYGDYVSVVSGVTVTEARQKDGLFEAICDNGKTYIGRKLILASGVQDRLPEIEGYADCWGKSILHCLFCKGFEQQGVSAGVLAGPAVPHALHVARQAAALVNGPVTIYTNGSATLAQELEAAWGTTTRMKIDARQIQRVAHKGEAGLLIEFADGSAAASERFLAHAPPTRPRGDFIVQLALETTPSGDLKMLPPFNQTNIRGVFAAGDNCSMLKTVPNAIWTGSLAAQGVLSQIQAEVHGQKPLFG